MKTPNDIKLESANEYYNKIQEATKKALPHILDSVSNPWGYNNPSQTFYFENYSTLGGYYLEFSKEEILNEALFITQELQKLGWFAEMGTLSDEYGSGRYPRITIYNPNDRFTPPKNFFKRLWWNLRGCPAHS